MNLLKKISFTAIIIMLVILAGATVIEKTMGSDHAKEMVYGSWPFALLWTLIAITSMLYILKRKLYRRVPAFLLHLSLLIILAGACTTWLSSVHGKMSIAVNESLSTFNNDKSETARLPFTVKLKDFKILYYAGTHAPLDFVSTLQIIDQDGTTTHGEVSMNHVFTHHGYRFFQSGYASDGQGAVFSIQHDSWGIGITYAGYLLLLVSIILALCDRHGKFRTLLRSHLSPAGALAVLMLLSLTPALAQERQAPPTLPKEVAQKLGDLYILHNDRMCPFETFARDFTMKLYGSDTFHDYSATQVAAGWMFYFEAWKDVAMIKVGGNAREILGIQGKYASFQDFVSTRNEYKLEGYLTSIMQGRQLNAAKGVREADEKYELASMMAMGELTRIFPLKTHGQLQWFSPASKDVPIDIDENKLIFISQGLNFLNELVAKNDMKGAQDFLTKFKEYQVKEGGSSLPGERRFKAEKVYNAISPIKPIAIAVTCLGMVLLIFMIRWISTEKEFNGKIVSAVNLCLIAIFIYLSVLIGLRWWISDHLPMSNGPETLEFMSWVTVIITLLLQRRYRMILSFGTLIAGLTLMVSSFGSSTPQLSQLMPVLHSPLLSIHVAVIMIAYSLLAFLMLHGIAAICIRKKAQQVQRLHIMGQILLYPAVFLLAIGIFIGAVWANVSWGTYWSWDPKEVWALITLITYALPLHTSSLPKLARPLYFHIYMAIAFFTVLVTYFGVNFLLGGMHSYA